jgi:GAF domain-containing protein
MPSSDPFVRLGGLARRVADASSALLTLHHEPLRLLAADSGAAESDVSLRAAPVLAALAELAVAADGPCVVADVRTDPRLVVGTESEAIAFLGFPLIDDDGTVLGSFGVVDRRVRRWSDDEVASLGDVAASVLTEIRLRRATVSLVDVVDAEAQQRTRLERLFQLARELSGAHGIEQVIERSTRLGGEVAGAVFANVAIADIHTGELEIRNGPALDAGIEARWQLVPLDAGTPLGSCLVTGLPVFLGSPVEIRERYPSGAADSAAAGFVALAAFPIRRGRAAMGFAWDHPVAFTPELRSVLSTVAELVGQGLERASANEEYRSIAEQLQRSLLPQRLIKIPGADIGALYETGTASVQVGGDWYDVATLGSERYILGVGDIVGRGLHAAASMGQMRNAFAALAPNTEDLLGLVERLDQFVLGVDGARLSTMVAAEYDADDGQLAVLMAGHLPPLIRRADATIEQLPDAGPPLGLDPAYERSVYRTTLLAGDALVIYTDGLVERRGESIDDGLARLSAALVDVDTASAEDMCHAIHLALDSPHDDDVAILVLIV